MNTEILTNSTAKQGFYAVKVRSCSEVTVAGALQTKGFEVLAPTYVEKRQYTDRIRKASKALFPGYVFVKMDADRLMPVVSTHGVSYVVKTGMTLTPLPPEEEAAIRSLAKMKVGCEPCLTLQPGQRVRIESGPLAGQQGTLVRLADKDRVVISLNSIFQSVSVDARDTRLTVVD